MDTLEYLTQHYPKGSPIFFTDIPLNGISIEAMRTRISRLVRNGKLIRVKRGLYYVPYKTMTGLTGMCSVLDYIDRRYMKDENEKVSGYFTGLQLANAAGVTTQNPAFYEIASNAATTRMRRETIEKSRLIITRPFAKIDESNVRELQFLDLLLDVDRYSELSGSVLQRTIGEFAEERCVNYEIARKYVSKYPGRIYKNIITAGLAEELLS